jgi:hypothetical protein
MDAPSTTSGEDTKPCTGAARAGHTLTADTGTDEEVDTEM